MATYMLFKGTYLHLNGMIYLSFHDPFNFWHELEPALSVPAFTRWSSSFCVRNSNQEVCTALPPPHHESLLA